MNRKQRRLMAFKPQKFEQALKEFQSNPHKIEFGKHRSAGTLKNGMMKTFSFKRSDIETIIKEKENK